MNYRQLQWLAGAFTVHRFSAETPIPAAFLSAENVTISRTADELSIVAPSSLKADAARSKSGWMMFKFIGPLDFGLTGILAGIANLLAEADISIFAISTFDTDYVMVKATQQLAVERILEAAGYVFV